MRNKLLRFSFNRRNSGLVLLMVSLAVVFTGAASIKLVSGAYLKEEHEKRIAAYGNFGSAAYYNSIQPLPEWDGDGERSDGFIEATWLESGNVIGTIDASAWSMALPLVEYRNPEPGHCIITQTVWNALSADEKENRCLNLESGRLQVDLVLNDYGYLWPRGEAETGERMMPPDILLNRRDFISLFAQGDHRLFGIVLSDSFETTAEHYFGTEGRHYSNYPVLMQEQEHMFSMPELYAPLTLAVLAAIEIIMLAMYKHSKKEKYYIYYIHGQPQQQLDQTLSAELFWVTFAAFLVSNGLTYIGSQVLLFFIYSSPKRIGAETFFLSTLEYDVLFWVGFLLYVMLYRKYDFVNSRNVPRKKAPQKLHLVQWRCIPYAFVLVLITFISAIFSSYLFHSYGEYESGISENAQRGRLSAASDIQAVLIPRFAPQGTFYHAGKMAKPSSENIALIVSPLEMSDHAGEMAEQIRNVRGVRDVLIYSEDHNIWSCVQAGMKEHPYLQGLYSANIVNADNEFWADYTDLSKNALIKSELLVLEDRELMSLDAYYEKDAIAAAVEGKGALLAAPAIVMNKTVTQKPDGSESVVIEWEKAGKDAEGAVYDETLRKGMSRELFFLSSREAAYGVFSAEDAKAIFQVRKLDVSIAGISYENAAWFGEYNYSGILPYRYLVSRAFLEQNDLVLPVSRLGIYLSDKEDGSAAAEITRILNNHGNFAVNDVSESLKDHHAYKVTARGYRIMTILLFIVLSLVATNAIATVMIESQKNRLQVFARLGLSNRRMALLNNPQYFIPFGAALLAITLISRVISDIAGLSFSGLCLFSLLMMLISVIEYWLFIAFHLKKTVCRL